MRIGALGDVLLTRRLAYSLSLAGYHVTVFAPGRHARILLADPWTAGVLDSENPTFAPVFEGLWPDSGSGRFDLAVVMSRSPGLERAARETAAHVVVVPPDSSREDAAVAVQLAQAVEALAPPFLGPLPLLPTDPRLATSPGALVIHAGSGSRRKNWPVERFAALGQAMANRGFKVLWTRGPADEGIPVDLPGCDVLDSPTLPGLAATLAAARAFVGNDSGVSHLAAAVGAPTLAIFGPTSDVVWRPDGPRVRTLRAASTSLADIGETEVQDILLRMLPEEGAGALDRS